MKKKLSIVAIVLAVILVIMIIVPFAFRGKIEEKLKAEGNKMLNAQFDYKKLSLSLFKDFPKATVSLSDFWLKGIGEFENDTLVKAGTLAATIDLFSLFGSSGYDVSKISVKDTWARAIVLADGTVNWDIMKVDSTATEGAAGEEETSPFKVQLRKVTVDNLNLIYDDRQEKMYMDVRNLDGQCSGDLGSDRTTLKIKAETKSFTFLMGSLPLLNKVNLSADMNIDADLANDKYTLEKNEFRLNAIKAGLDGWVALKDPAVEMDLAMNTSEVGFKEILSLIPAIYAKEFASLKTDGTVTITALAKGTLDEDVLPMLDVKMEVRNAMFRYPSLPAGIDNINVLASIKNPGGKADLTTININPLSFSLAGNAFSLSGDIKTPVSDPDFKVNANGILNLGEIKNVYPLEDMELNGLINANLAMSGRMSYIEKEQYDKVSASGTIKLSDMKLTMKDIPDVDIKQSLFTFSPQYLQLSETTVNIGKNDLTADCRFEGYMGFALKGGTLKGNLNVRSNHFNLNDFMGNEEATAAGTDTVPMGLIDIPKNIDFNMDASMKEVIMGEMTFSNVNGKLLIKDGKADMKNLSMNAMGGSMVMNGYYSTADAEKPVLNANFNVSELGFAKAYKDLNLVQQMAPVFENLKGTFSGNMSINTLLDNEMSPILSSVQGEGKLSTKNLNLSGVEAIDKIADAVNRQELKNISAKDMSLDFAIKDGRLSTRPFDIKWNDYAMNLSGSTGLDQTIDYAGKVKLPASAGSLAQLSTVDFKIGGTFTSPSVSVDMESMAKQAVGSVAGQLLDKLGGKQGSLANDSTTATDTAGESTKEKVKESVKGLLDKLK